METRGLGKSLRKRKGPDKGMYREQARRRETRDSEIVRFDARAWCASEFASSLVKVDTESFVIDSVSDSVYKLS
jgi:hypothetical protein